MELTKGAFMLYIEFTGGSELGVIELYGRTSLHHIFESANLGCVVPARRSEVTNTRRSVLGVNLFAN